MIKRLKLSVACAFVFLSATAQFSGRYTITGKVETYASHKGKIKVLLTKGLINENGEPRMLYDTAELINGRFSFTGTVSEPGEQTLQIQHPGLTEMEDLTIWLEKGNLSINTRKFLKDAEVKGPQGMLLYPKRVAMIEKISRKSDSLYWVRKQLDSARVKMYDEMYESYLGFIDSFPESSHSVVLLSALLDNAHLNKQMGTLSEERMQLLEEANRKIQQYNKGESLLIHADASLKGLKTNNIGDPVQHFSLPGIDGKPVNTKTLQGKVFLIDFWGSWCPSCRKGHPHMKELYEQYKNKGLEIIAVAKEFGDREQQLEKWKKAVREDKIPWIHVINGEGTDDVTVTYGIRLYPTKVLVDQNGKVVLRVTDDEERKLDAKLAELLN